MPTPQEMMHALREAGWKQETLILWRDPRGAIYTMKAAYLTITGREAKPLDSKQRAAGEQ